MSHLRTVMELQAEAHKVAAQDKSGGGEDSSYQAEMIQNLQRQIDGMEADHTRLRAQLHVANLEKDQYYSGKEEIQL